MNEPAETEPATLPNGVPHVSPAQRQQNLDDPSKLRELIAELNLYIGYYEETQLTTEQKELLYDAVEAHHPDIYGHRDENGRWWRLSAEEQAAQLGRTA